MERSAGVTVWSDWQDQISGEVDWEQKSCVVMGSGTHTLEWQYVKDSGGSEGEDCGWVDYVQDSRAAPPPAVSNTFLLSM